MRLSKKQQELKERIEKRVAKTAAEKRPVAADQTSIRFDLKILHQDTSIDPDQTIDSRPNMSLTQPLGSARWASQAPPLQNRNSDVQIRVATSSLSKLEPIPEESKFHQLGAIGLNSYSSKFSPKAFPHQGVDIRAPGMGRMLPQLETIYRQK